MSNRKIITHGLGVTNRMIVEMKSSNGEWRLYGQPWKEISEYLVIGHHMWRSEEKNVLDKDVARRSILKLTTTRK